MIVSVITPTYNRINLLYKLYSSLLDQTSYDFEWILVDDGSQDDTENVVNKWIRENKIRIKYLKKENGGKHTAVNLGVKYATGEMSFIVDSDDYLIPQAIKIIHDYYKKYKLKDGICGFSFLKGSEDGSVIGLKYPKDEMEDNYNVCRIKRNIYGDKAEVFYTAVLQKYPFPEISGEKFLSEDIIWLEIAKRYNTIYINQIIYICKYLDDGLTFNDKKLKFSSPIGSTLRGIAFMRSNLPLKYKLKGAIIYNCYSNRIKKNNLIHLNHFFEKLLAFITFIPSKIYRKTWNRAIK